MSHADGFHVGPLSRTDIRQHTRIIRDLVGRRAKFPIVEFLEFVLPKQLPEFCLSFLSPREMFERYGYGVEGMTMPDKELIILRQDIYLHACAHDGRARFSLAHELGHYCLHRGGGFARVNSFTPIYCNSEWQANVFAAELLVDVRQMGDCLDVPAVANRFSVSDEAARIALHQYRSEGLLDT